MLSIQKLSDRIELAAVHQAVDAGTRECGLDDLYAYEEYASRLIGKDSMVALVSEQSVMQDMRSNQRGCRAGGRGHSRRSSVHVSIRLRVLSRQARAQFPSAFFSAATSFSRLSTCRTSASFRARSRVSSFSMLSLTLRTAARRSERGSPPPPPGPCRQEVTEQGHPRQQGMAAVGRAIGRTADGTSTRHHAACTSSTLPPTRRRPRSTPIWRLQPCGRTHRRAPAACRGPGASMHRWRTKDCAVGSVARAQQLGLHVPRLRRALGS